MLKPKIFHFDNYTFVIGNDSLKKPTINLYYKDSKILIPQHSDGFYDTIIQVNLNGDGIPDFLVSYGFEDGAMLYGLVSKTHNSFIEKTILKEWSSTYCPVGGDTILHIQPLQIKDIDKDGKDDIICNLVKINNKTFAIPCTDTVFANKIE